MRVLFVCLGNICRSPAAEGYLRHIVDKRGLSDSIEIDSAGTGAWHVGERADSRMRRVALSRGYRLTSLARKFVPDDFENSDLIVAMDHDNKRDILHQDRKGQYGDKVRLFSDFVPDAAGFPDAVPDPYYGGPAGFAHTLDMVEAGCEGILAEAMK